MPPIKTPEVKRQHNLRSYISQTRRILRKPNLTPAQRQKYKDKLAVLEAAVAIFETYAPTVREWRATHCNKS
jgi:hypothetical protein